jgi:hypothetical protein
VDVSLSREGVRIACEISVTTKSDHELRNVEKYLAAGYRDILLVGRMWTSLDRGGISRSGLSFVSRAQSTRERCHAKKVQREGF